MRELWKKRSIKIAVIIMLVLVIGIIVGIIVQGGQKKREYNAHIEAAEKYLSELDYEQAIAEYIAALEIEPKQQYLLQSLENTFLAYAQSYMDVGEYEKAKEILEKGLENMNNELFRKKLREVQTVLDISKSFTQAQKELEMHQYEAAIENYLVIIKLDPYNMNAYLGIIQAYIGVGDMGKALMYAEQGLELTKGEKLSEKVEALQAVREYALEVKSLIDSEDYPELADLCDTQGIKEMLRKITGKDYDDLGNCNYFYYLDSVVNKEAVVIFETSKRFYVYYGDYVNKEREGVGTWFGRKSESIYEVYQGYWKDEVPDGEGKIIRYDSEESQVASKVSVRQGNFVKGLMDGNFTFENEYNGDGVIHKMQAYFDKGIAKDRTQEYLTIHGSVDIPQDDIIVAFEDGGDWYCRASYDQNWGVLGFR